MWYEELRWCPHVQYFLGGEGLGVGAMPPPPPHLMYPLLTLYMYKNDLCQGPDLCSLALPSPSLLLPPSALLPPTAPHLQCGGGVRLQLLRHSSQYGLVQLGDG